MKLENIFLEEWYFIFVRCVRHVHGIQFNKCYPKTTTHWQLELNTSFELVGL